MSILLMMAMLLSWSPSEVIQDYIVQNYPWDNVSVEHVRYYGKMPAERPVNIMVQRGPVGNATFLFEFPDGSYKKVYAMVDATRKVVKTVYPLRKGTVLTDKDIYLADTDIRRLPRNAITDPKDALGKVLIRSVRADMVLTDTLLTDKPLIRKGQKVMIVYEGPGLRLTAPGIAREDGTKGKAIHVLNLWTKKVLIGFVRDSSTINITP